MNDTDKRAIEEIPADAVIQALKCCASEEDNCHRCPFKGVGTISDSCISAMSRSALDLIYRKQSNDVPDTNVGCKFCENDSLLDNLVCYIPTDDGASIEPPVRYCPFCGARMKGGA